MNKTTYLVTVLKGMVVGGTMLVPGVSGGSMAMILGIYHKLVSAVSSFMKNKRESFMFLALFSMGGGLGMLLFADPLLRLIGRYPAPMLYFFMGAVAGSVPVIGRQAQITAFTWKAAFYMIIGLAVVLLLSMIPAGSIQLEAEGGPMSFLLLSLAGVIAAAALVLPGISVSYLLLVIGLYDETMRAVGSLHLPFLIPLGAGLLLGIVLTTKGLERAMAKYPQPVYLIILGFMLGSMAEVFPGLPEGREYPACILMLAAGYGVIRLLNLKESKRAAAGVPEFE